MAGLLRGHEGVRPQGIEAVNCLRRVAACVGGNFLWDLAGVTHGLLNHALGLTLVRGLVGSTGRHDDLVGAVHHRLALA